MAMNDKTYDALKWIAMIVLLAVAILYFTLESILGLQYGEQIVGTITAVDAFLGALLGISNVKYKKNM